MCLKELSMPPCLETGELAELESICPNALTVILEIKQHISKTRSNNLMIKKFKKYWDVIADHILIAHVLDLRYKMKYLRAIIIDVGEYTENEANQYVNSVHEKIILYGQDIQHHPQPLQLQ
ncbi:15555_t:CDS:2 [Rhizophagus irregularis]|nr:15555_t:CDS:2 [Rhizophagus irregularis]